MLSAAITLPLQTCPRCGGTHSGGCRPEALIGTILANRYRLLRVVGEGGMGTVYEAEHVELSRTVALKLMHPRMDVGEQARRRFAREAQAAAATGHENVVDVFDLGRDERGVPFLVMELLRGIDLGRAIHHVGRMDARRSAWIVGQVLLALEAVHAVGIHHRDLKPDNVFLTKRAGISDWVKVLDFGVAEFADMQGAGELPSGPRKVTAGTLHYMAPEQASGASGQDQRVDVYAAGVLLYECLTGELPFEAASARALRHEVIANSFSPVEVHAPELAPDLSAIVGKAMSRLPQDRHESARALFDALRPFGAGSAPSPAQLTPSRGILRAFSATQSARLAPPNHIEGTVTAHPRAGVFSPPASAQTDFRVFAPRPQRMAATPHAYQRASPIAAMPAERPLLPQQGPAAAAKSAAENHVRRSGAHLTQAARNRGPLRLRARWVGRIARHIAESHGASAYADLLAKLPAEARSIFSGVLLPTAWVGALDLDALLQAAALGASARSVGRAAAEACFVPGSAPANPDPRSWAGALAHWLEGVAPEVSPLPAGLLRISLAHSEPPAAVVGAAISGVLEAFAIRAGARIVAVSHSSEASCAFASLTIRAKS